MFNKEYDKEFNYDFLSFVSARTCENLCWGGAGNGPASLFQTTLKRGLKQFDKKSKATSAGVGPVCTIGDGSSQGIKRPPKHRV